MDFNSKYNSREAAEHGVPMQILDPWSGEPVMSGDKPCRVIVRGTASRSVQAAIRANLKAKIAAKKDGDAEDDARIMEDIHDELCESAAPFIVGFENVERGNKPATAKDAKWFLDLTFPVMGLKEGENGEPVLSEAGKVQFEMKNNPFAKQIGEFAGQQADRLGNAQKG